MHAPVLGSVPNDEEIYFQNKNVFEALGKRVKLACNLFIANFMVEHILQKDTGVKIILPFSR